LAFDRGAGGGVRGGDAGCAAAVEPSPNTSAALTARWATTRPAITKSLWSDAHRPPDLVRSTGGTSI